MKKIMRLQLIYISIFAALIILLCPCITDIYKYNKVSINSMISELKAEDVEEPLYFNIESTLKRLPNELIRRLYDIGVTINTTDDIGECSKYGRVTSKYSHKNKTITIQKTYSNEAVLLHEIGHAISYNELPIIKLSDTYKFKKIYENEKDLIFPDGEKLYYHNFNVKYEYLKVNSEEYFAQCFSMYMLEILPEEAKTYKFFEEYFKESGIKDEY
ncbi:hypothetical protein H9X78_11555 [Clostridium saudiense]|nr:hypothetical protein [Clostridium saudiense]